jgi:glycosyltransferase involved in cell wall biosynthesis
MATPPVKADWELQRRAHRGIGISGHRGLPAALPWATLSPRRMRITIVLPEANMSGGIRVAAIYAERLHRRGHKVFVIYPEPYKQRLTRKVGSWLKGNGWPKDLGDGPSHLDIGDYERKVLRPWQPVTDAHVPDADVVIATWWETAEWVAALSARKGTKVYFIQGYEISTGRHIERLKATWCLPMHKIVVSSWLQEVARTEFGDPCVSMVSNSVDLSQFNAPPRSKRSVPRVGMVYSQEGHRGCDISLKAYALAAQARSNLELLAFGQSPPDQTLPVPGGTQFTLNPSPQDLASLYASCDAWLFGSRQEGFGLPILEAMACRTPVIAAPAGAAPELLKSGGGLLVRPEDPLDMSRAILKMCDLPDAEWAAMSEQAHATACSYSWDDATDRFLGALDMAIERHKRGELDARPQRVGAKNFG